MNPTVIRNLRRLRITWVSVRILCCGQHTWWKMSCSLLRLPSLDALRSPLPQVFLPVLVCTDYNAVPETQLFLGWNSLQRTLSKETSRVLSRMLKLNFKFIPCSVGTSRINTTLGANVLTDAGDSRDEKAEENDHTCKQKEAIELCSQNFWVSSRKSQLRTQRSRNAFCDKKGETCPDSACSLRPPHPNIEGFLSLLLTTEADSIGK